MGFESLPVSRNLESQDRAKTVDTILAEKEKRTELSGFYSVYGEEEVKKDETMVAQLKRKFESDYENEDQRRGQRFSAAFERMFKEWASRFGWFGANSEIIPASEYDDYKNGVDGILVLNKPKQGAEYVALAIDTTHAGVDKLEMKMTRALDHVIGKTKPVILKYFEHKNFRGPLDGSIPVVIGLDSRDADQIIDTFGQVLTLLKQEKRAPRQDEILKEKIETLKKHPAQTVFFEEIKLQLEMYQRELAKIQKPTKDNIATKGHVDNILRLITSIAKERSHIALGDMKNDNALQTIRDFCAPRKSPVSRAA